MVLQLPLQAAGGFAAGGARIKEGFGVVFRGLGCRVQGGRGVWQQLSRSGCLTGFQL